MSLSSGLQVPVDINRCMKAFQASLTYEKLKYKLMIKNKAAGVKCCLSILLFFSFDTISLLTSYVGTPNKQ